ncbi:MAG: grasp-with-spasm system ATP-grasp peptide maturase [Chitinophagaceae bacterium]|nr:grasp-with-spasm system ATP-grasp peptide maturase [Chitinophagaceae bacterium]
MIFLISQHNSDHTTNDVSDWLWHKKASYRRINGVDAYDAIDYPVDIQSKEVAGYRGLHHQIIGGKKVIWFRRWLPPEYYYTLGAFSDKENLNRQMTDYLKQEGAELRNYFMHLFVRSADSVLTDFTKAGVNKIYILELAESLGMTIPTTIITGSKKTLQTFMKNTGEVIVKNIKDAGFFEHQEKFYVSFTALVRPEDVEQAPDNFFPSLFQQAIQKSYEIRVFYLDGTCYAMAIFSQASAKTSVDFRNYDYRKPSRNVPYNLPEELQQKVDKLMKSAGLNCGSLDFIRSSTGEYVFLEINPVGQFGFVSEPCNYYLEEKVADWLIAKEIKE